MYELVLNQLNANQRKILNNFLIKNKFMVSKSDAANDGKKNAENSFGIVKNKTPQSTNEIRPEIY